MAKTPKKYKGFSMLPEAVQQKMDPKAAMQYMEGGAVKKPKVSMYIKGGSVEKDGVLTEVDPEPKKASTKGATSGGKSRGGGAAISGLKFEGTR